MDPTPKPHSQPEVAAPVDLEAYGKRIGWTGGWQPSLETFRGIHLAHAETIPYENLDILLGKRISLEPEQIERKLVRQRRGGYCFEQNGLLARVLEQIGFTVTRLAARVRLQASQLTPRTHQILLIRVDDQEWLADVGFGSWGLVEPIPLRANEHFHQGPWEIWLEREGNQWVLKSAQSPIGLDQYSFLLEPQQPIDYEPANHYCSTHPDSKFVKALTAQKAGLKRRYLLRNLELFVSDAEGTVSRQIPPQELLMVLQEFFGLEFPEGTVFRTSSGPVN